MVAGGIVHAGFLSVLSQNKEQNNVTIIIIDYEFV